MSFFIFLLKGFLFPDPKNADQRVAFKSFFSRVNFSVPVNDEKLFLAVERYFIKEIQWVISLPQRKSNFSGTVHVHSTLNDLQTWRKLLIAYYDPTINYSFAKTELNFLSLGQKVSLVFQLFIFYPFARFLFFKKRYNRNILSSFRALTLGNQICALIKTNKVREIVFTGAYDPDGNILSAYLKSIKFNVATAVSGTPLFRFMKEIVTGRLLLTNPYQEDECKAFQSTILFRERKLLPPITSPGFIHLYSGEVAEPAVNIGIYTSGAWLRFQKKMFSDENVINAEQMIFHATGRLMRQKNIKVKFYFHPLEKRDSRDFEMVKKYYSNYFTNPDFLVFPEKGDRTDQCFSEVDLAISHISNTVFERLYAGFKTLIVTSENNFPLPGSSLNGITCKSELELEEKMIEVLALSREEYFKKFDLENYHHKNYLSLSQL